MGNCNLSNFSESVICSCLQTSEFSDSEIRVHSMESGTQMVTTSAVKPKNAQPKVEEREWECEIRPRPSSSRISKSAKSSNGCDARRAASTKGSPASLHRDFEEAGRAPLLLEKRTTPRIPIRKYTALDLLDEIALETLCKERSLSRVSKPVTPAVRSRVVIYTPKPKMRRSEDATSETLSPSSAAEHAGGNGYAGSLVRPLLNADYSPSDTPTMEVSIDGSMNLRCASECPTSPAESATSEHRLRERRLSASKSELNLPRRALIQQRQYTGSEHESLLQIPV